MISSPGVAPPFARWLVGEVRITRVPELAPMAFDPALFLHATRAQVLLHRGWLVPDFATEAGDILLHFQAFVVEVAGKRILVDPCVGNDKDLNHAFLNRLSTRFLEKLEEAGFPRHSIDLVVCTHLHLDHCGWNTMLVDGGWVPTFPNARYLFAREELEYLEGDTTDPNAPALLRESILPILEAGLADFVEPGHPIADGVVMLAAPGHTPGHRVLHISSDGAEAILTGDVLHHPLQIALPNVSSRVCWDDEMAVDTRTSILHRAAERHALVVAAHFAGPTAVRIKTNGDAWTIES